MTDGDGGPDVLTIPFGSFAAQLDSLVVALGNKIDREWPAKHASHPGAQPLILGLLKVSENTYRTVRYFAADEPVNHARKPQFALSISPLSRTVLEALFTTVFLFGDLAARTDWYYRAGWRELREENERLNSTHGSDPHWADWLKQHDAALQKLTADVGITAGEVANPKLIDRFPNPGRMPAHRTLTKDRRDYLQYLNDWHYRALSQDAHLSWTGLVRRASVLMPGRDLPDSRWMQIKSDSVMTLVTLLLALASELEVELRFGLKDRLQYVWGVTNPFWELGKEVYDRFYAEFFQQA